MGIQNRDKGLNEQVDNWDVQTPVEGVSVLIQVASIPYACNLLRVVTSAFGLSGSPILGIQIQRFVTGSGNTTIAINGSSLLTITAYSTSGLQIHSLPAVGNSLVTLQANDSLQIVTSGANTAANYAINAVTQCLQDFKTQYGLFSAN